MSIDFAKLRLERQFDPFAVAPIHISQGVRFATEVLRDGCLSNPEILAMSGHGVSRVFVVSPSPQLRQTLAILDWLPHDPASDGLWFIDEPVDLPAAANATVCDFTARYHAENMNLLFAPDHGVFEGGAVDLLPGPNAPAQDVRAFLRLMAERRYVAEAVIARTVPIKPLHYKLGRDIGRTNSARARVGLAPLVCPSVGTIGRWLKEIAGAHRGRAGLGAGWRSYQPVFEDRDVPHTATRSTGHRSD